MCTPQKSTLTFSIESKPTYYKTFCDKKQPVPTFKLFDKYLLHNYNYLSERRSDR